MSNDKAIIGSILGTALGDAMGLPCEGLSRQRQPKLFPQLDRPRLLFGHGMISDDTEHSCMVAQALIVSGGDERLFARALAWKLRWWLLGIPAGIGFATLKAILKLWAGASPQNSGVFSAGNGPAMRSAIIGAAYGHEPKKMCALVRASSRLTHTDPKADQGAQAVALAAYYSSLGAAGAASSEAYCRILRDLLGPSAEEFLRLIDQAAESARAQQSAQQFADTMGQTGGISGYTFHTVAVVLQIWFRYPDNYRAAIEEIIRCGGDADSTAAILGGIIGARVGKEGIPVEWREAICEWPRSLAWMESLGTRLALAVACGQAQPPVRLPVPAVLLRNLFFAAVVLSHGFRRLAPPY
jgi:ADP-ribosyl-[dinitrogen reductase] hydrolase